MTRLPRITGKKLISFLKKKKFQVIRIKGSHHFIRHPDGRATVVPMHSGENLGPGLLTKILNNIEMTSNDIKDI